MAAADLITLTATITDNDGDEASATHDIGQSLNFEDDGPTITADGVVPELTVDETDLTTDASASFAAAFTSDAGADGDAITYALGISQVTNDSGLTDTATGDPVLLFVEGGNVVGRAGSAAGPIVFTVSVSAAGIVSLDQARAIVHADATDPDDSTTLAAADLITLTATITDNDGDEASATHDIGQSLNFEDDGPTITADGVVPELTVDETDLTTDASADFSTAFTWMPVQMVTPSPMRSASARSRTIAASPTPQPATPSCCSWKVATWSAVPAQPPARSCSRSASAPLAREPRPGSGDRSRGRH